jgi:intraflagellar transport protein 88
MIYPFNSLTALVNKGNVLFANKDYEKAREFYNEALQNDSSCIEALYNFGECISDEVQPVH